MNNRGNILLMLNKYMYLLTEIYEQLDDDEITIYNNMLTHITPADELDNYGGNLIITINQKEIAILDKMTAINAAIKINDNTYKINPRFACCVKAYDEDQELTASLAIDFWDEFIAEKNENRDLTY